MDFESLGMETPREDLEALAGLAQHVHKTARSHPTRVVEIGTWVGRTAVAMAESLPAEEPLLIYCIDHFQGNPNDVCGTIAKQHSPYVVYDTLLNNLAQRSLWLTRVIPIFGPAAAMAARWPFPVDLVFIDGDHRYEFVLEDIDAWWPHVREGGVLCGHDLNLFSGVNQAVDARFGSSITELGRSIWAIQK